MTPEALLDHYDKATLWPAGRSDVAAAYQDALALRALLEIALR
jgi:2-oxo-3-hexenedioate decarboxylase